MICNTTDCKKTVEDLLIDKYGVNGKGIFLYAQICQSYGSSWECQDCVILDDDEYFETLNCD
jgi:hypothetical protein